VGYVTNSKYEGLTLRRPRELSSISLSDSYYAKDTDNRRSISGRVNTIGGMMTSWSSKKQATVTLSSTEAEYIALSDCCQESMFTQALLKELTGEENTAIIYADNFGAIFLSKNQQVSSRTKHIDVRHHYIRELREEGKLDIRFVRSEDNSSDIMTKNLPRNLHEKHTEAMMTGTLQCWREDVRSDPSVRHFNEQNVQSVGLERQTESYFSPEPEAHLLDYFSPSFRDSVMRRPVNRNSLRRSSRQRRSSRTHRKTYRRAREPKGQ
jgi:hypothetical protein